MTARSRRRRVFSLASATLGIVAMIGLIAVSFGGGSGGAAEADRLADGGSAGAAGYVTSAPFRPLTQASHGPADPGVVGSPTWLPPVIFNDGVESASLTVSISGGAFDSIFITADGVLTPDADLPPNLALLNEDDLIQLYDDGTNGDTVANDGTYSRSGITATGALTHDGGTHQRLETQVLAFVEDVDGGGVSVSSSSLTLESGLSVVDVSQRGTAPVTTLGPNLTATSHALFLVDDGTLFPGYPQINAETATQLCLSCEILINTYGDVFDFIVLQSREVVTETPSCDCQAFFSNTSNDITGIGLGDAFDRNIGAGVFTTGEPFNTFSAGRLQGIIYNNRLDGPALSHEVMHRWSVSAAPGLGWLDGAGHFIASSTINGIMDLLVLDGGGAPITRVETPLLPADYVANGDGTFRLVSRPGEFNTTFAPISLYLAGFIPPAQVPLMQILSGSINISDQDAVTATTVTDVTIDQVIAQAGERVPSSASAPREFTVGTLVFGDRAYTEAEYTFITLALRYWESNKTYDGFGAPPWQAATQGQSTLTVALPTQGSEPEPEPEPEPEETAETRTLTLVPGWNFVAWTGDASSVGDAIASISASTVGNLTFFTRDPSTLSFSSFSSSQPAFLNSLTGFANGEAIWIFVDGSGSVSWEQVVVATARQLSLSPGFNMVSWTGPDGTPIDVVLDIQTATVRVFAWDPISQRFQQFDPNLPSALSDLSVLNFGTAIWIEVFNPTTWDQPAP